MRVLTFSRNSHGSLHIDKGRVEVAVAVIHYVFMTHLNVLPIEKSLQIFFGVAEMPVLFLKETTALGSHNTGKNVGKRPAARSELKDPRTGSQIEFEGDVKTILREHYLRLSHKSVHNDIFHGRLIEVIFTQFHSVLLSHEIGIIKRTPFPVKRSVGADPLKVFSVLVNN